MTAPWPSLATAKAKADRYARLLAQNAIAPQAVDDAQAAYLQAKAKLDIGPAQSGITPASARRSTARPARSWSSRAIMVVASTASPRPLVTITADPADQGVASPCRRPTCRASRRAQRTAA